MKTNNETERGEWTSASAAESDAACKGRHLMQRNLPDEKSDDAASGTRIHDALVKGSDEGLSQDESETYGKCCEIERELIVRYFGFDTFVNPPEREVRYWTSFGDLKHSGQNDSSWRASSKCLLLDYKTGRNEVAASPRNMQLRDLAVLKWMNTPLLSEIAVAIIQPFVTSEPEICIYKEIDIDRAFKEMAERVMASNDPNSPRTAGEIQCKYCRALSICPEAKEFFLNFIVDNLNA